MNTKDTASPATSGCERGTWRLATGLAFPPAEGVTLLGRNGFGEDEDAVQRVHGGESRRREEGKPQADAAQHPPDGGPEDESEAEGDADEPEVPSPFLGSTVLDAVGSAKAQGPRQ